MLLFNCVFVAYVNTICDFNTSNVTIQPGALNVSTDYLLNISSRKRISSQEESLLQKFNRCDEDSQQYLLAKAGVLCVEGISAVAAGEYGKYADEEKKSFPSSGTEGKGA